MLSRAQNATKPAKRFGKIKEVDMSIPSKTQSISVSLPVNFNVQMFANYDPKGTQSLMNTAVKTFDIISMLNSSQTFMNLSKVFKECKIQKVHGCIDLNRVPTVQMTIPAGEMESEYAGTYEIPTNNLLLNCAMSRTIQLGKYFEDYIHNYKQVTYDDVVSMGSCIWQSLIPGASLHLSPEIKASGMMEKTQYINTEVFRNLKLLKSFESSQYFLPTFYLAMKNVFKDIPGYRQAFANEYNIPLTETVDATYTTNVTLDISCQFYIDVVFRNLHLDVSRIPTSTVYSYCVCNAKSTATTNDTVSIHLPIFKVGFNPVYDMTTSVQTNMANPLYACYVGLYDGTSVDVPEGYTPFVYYGVLLGKGYFKIKRFVNGITGFNAEAGLHRYIIIGCYNNAYPLTTVANTSYLSGNDIIDDADVVVDALNYTIVYGNLAFNSFI